MVPCRIDGDTTAAARDFLYPRPLLRVSVDRVSVTCTGRGRRGSVTLLAPETLVGGYRIERLLGAGGMGVVYQATQLSLSRTVALKILADEYRVDPVFRERFRREGIAQAALEHPHIVPVYEADERDDQFFIAMRYIRGGSLKDLVIEMQLAPRRAMHLLRQIAEALDAAHAVGLVHRDIKPQNILVEGNTAYLADFGLTRMRGDSGLTETGVQLGTLDYMSPEQFRNEPVTARSDIYSFAALAFECLSGDVPFPRGSQIALMYAHLEDPPPTINPIRSDVPVDVDRVIARAMAKDPAARPSSAMQFMRELTAAVGARVAGPSGSFPIGPESVLGHEEGATVAARFRSRAPRAEAGARWRTRRRIQGFALVVALITASAAGAALKRSEHHLGDGTSSHTVSVGSASFRMGLQWQETKDPDAVQASLSQARGFTLRQGGARVSLTVGVSTQTSSNSVLPAGFSAVSKPTLVRVRSGVTGVEYPEARVADLGDLVLYAFPTAGGTIVVTCRGGSRTRDERACNGVVGTLSSASSSLIAVRSALVTGLSRAWTELVRARRSAREAMVRASRPAGQAAAARRAASAYDRAATRIGTLPIPPSLGATRATLVSVLRGSSRAYAGLAAAASSRSSEDFGRAASRVIAADSAVNEASAHLVPAGEIVARLTSDS